MRTIWKHDYNTILTKVRERGFEMMTSEEEYNIKKTKSNIIVKDNDGYLFPINVSTILYKNLSNSNRTKMFSKDNPFLEYNIKKMIKNEKNDEFLFIDNQIDDTFNRNKELYFVCKKCNTKFKMSLFNALRGTIYSGGKNDQHNGLTCPVCDRLIESKHANALKQVFLHEFPDTVLEDKSCRNPLTNSILPTDIVNHRLKIAIEIQSELHNREYQKVKDSFKKDYWIKNGYTFYDYYIEEYSILEYIQLFFPDITVIPDYVTYDFSKTFNFIKAQDLLNNGYTVTEISKIMHVKIHRIYDALQNKKIFYPEGYQKYNLISVVMLDKYKKYVRTYNCYGDAEKDNNIPRGNIASCISSKHYYANGYYWIPLEKYKNGDYKIPDNRLLKFGKSVNAYDENGIFIKEYDSINEASKDLGIIRYNIWRVAEGIRKKCKGYRFSYV